MSKKPKPNDTQKKVQTEAETGKIDWGYQIKYFLVMLVGIMAVFLVLRFFGLRG